MKFAQSLFAFLLIVILLGCEEQNPKPESGVIYVTEEITTPTTWFEGNIYVIDYNGDFSISALLTIEPNVIVKSLRQKQNIVVSGGGVVIAKGTPEKPIIFTSQYDDIHGGDIIGNGLTAPAPGDWGRFYFKSVSGSEFSYCHFYYGGSLAYSTIKADYSTIDINNCVFAYNMGGYILQYIGVVDLDLANSDCNITNNVFYANELPLTINANISIDNSNTFYDPENPEIGNKMNGIFTNTQVIDENVSWLENEVPFVIANNSELRIESNGSLTLGDGAVIKIVMDTCINLVNNPEGIINYNGAGVYFTSFSDDSLLGDTNGDNSSLAPAAGDWQGIRIALNPPTYADWLNILYD